MIESLVNSLGDAINPWGYVLVFVLAMLEASAFIGLFVPGEVALLIAGALAQEGKLSLIVVMVCAVAGAIVGDSLGYEIGRHLGPRMRRGWLGRLVGQERWDKANEYVRKRGGRAVFFGRFVGFARALVPAIVGDSRMPYKKFLLWNVLGALCTSPLVVLAGYLAGSSYKKVEGQLTHASWILGGLVILFVIYKVVKGIRHKGAHDEESNEPSGVGAP